MCITMLKHQHKRRKWKEKMENGLFEGLCGNSINDKEGKGWWEELIKVLLRDPFELSASNHHCLHCICIWFMYWWWSAATCSLNDLIFGFVCLGLNKGKICEEKERRKLVSIQMSKLKLIESIPLWKGRPTQLKQCSFYCTSSMLHLPPYTSSLIIHKSNF